MVRRFCGRLRSKIVTSRIMLVARLMRPARRYSRLGDTSLMIVSLNATVGFLREMSPVSVARRWLARGSTWSLKKSMNAVNPSAATSTGATRRCIDTPLALYAVISFSDASRLNACSVATRMAMGSVIATVNGTESAKNSAMTVQCSPFPTRSPNFLAT